MMTIQDEIRHYIVDQIMFGQDEGVDADVSFQDSGILDSTGLLELITFVEGRFGVRITDAELVPENFDTLRKVSEFVADKLRAKADLPSESGVSCGSPSLRK